MGLITKLLKSSFFISNSIAKLKLVPIPSSLSKTISLSKTSINFFTIDSPKPVPL